jgi:hypothetical protein
MYFKMDFIDGISLNSFELKLKQGLPCIRFSGLKFKSFDAVNRFNTILKSMKIKLPKKTLHISFKTPVNYDQYRQIEFYLIWSYVYLVKDFPKPKFYLISGLSVDLTSDVLVRDTKYHFLQFVNYIDTNKFENLKICFEKKLSAVINILLSNKCNILLLGPYGEGKTTELLNHQNASAPVLTINSSNTSQEIKRLISSLETNSKILILVDELSDYSVKSLSLFKVLFDKTLFSNVTILASSNPCRCGFFKSQIDVCSCSQTSLKQFYKNLNKGLLDRFSAIIYYDQNTNLHFKNIINEPVIEDFDLNQNIKMACIRYKMNPRKKDQFIKVLKAFSLEFKNSTAFALSEYVMFAYDSLL